MIEDVRLNVHKLKETNLYIIIINITGHRRRKISRNTASNYVCWTRMIFRTGSAVWSFDRRQSILRCDNITQIGETANGGDCPGTFFCQKLASKKDLKVSGFVPSVFGGFRLGLVVSWDGWIVRACPIVGIMIYRTEMCQSPTFAVFVSLCLTVR